MRILLDECAPRRLKQELPGHGVRTVPENEFSCQGPSLMQTIKFIYWQEEKAWLGYLQDYPDYWTQGQTLADLKEHLKDLYDDLTSGELPGIRKVGELALP